MFETQAKQQDREPWTASSLAREAGVNRTYIARLCKQGKIPAKKYATVWIIPFEVGQAWLEERQKKQEEQE